MGYKNRVQLSAHYTSRPLQWHLLYLILKPGVVSPLLVSNSVVVGLSRPPINRTPSGEFQAAWPRLLFFKVWDFFHSSSPLENLSGHSVHNNTEHFLWSQVGKWAIMGQKLIYYHIGTPTYMLNDVSKHPRPLKIMLNHIFKNQCHKPRNKKNTFLVSKVG